MAERLLKILTLPIGLTRSISLAVLSGFFSTFVLSTSNLILLFGYSGVRLSKAILFLPFSGSSKLILLTLSKAKYLSASLGALTSPLLCHLFLSQIFLFDLGSHRYHLVLVNSLTLLLLKTKSILQNFQDTGSANLLIFSASFFRIAKGSLVFLRYLDSQYQVFLLVILNQLGFVFLVLVSSFD